MNTSIIQNSCTQDSGNSDVDREISTAEIIWESHAPGINDMIPGAVHPSDWTLLSMGVLIKEGHTNENDCTICIDNWDDMVVNMPYYLLDRNNLETLCSFTNPMNIDRLQENIHITIRGLIMVAHEYEEACKFQNFGIEEKEILLLNLIMRRGGVPPAGADVFYPEDLVPIVDEDNEAYDGGYWEEIAGLRLD